MITISAFVRIRSLRERAESGAEFIKGLTSLPKEFQREQYIELQVPLSEAILTDGDMIQVPVKEFCLSNPPALRQKVEFVMGELVGPGRAKLHNLLIPICKMFAKHAPDIPEDASFDFCRTEMDNKGIIIYWAHPEDDNYFAQRIRWEILESEDPDFVISTYYAARSTRNEIP